MKFVPIDGQASKDSIEQIVNMLPKQLQKLSLEEQFYIGNLLNSQKQASDFFIDYNFKVKELPVGVVNWAYGLKENKSFNYKVSKICPKTFRLVSMYGDKKWEDYV